MPNLLADVTSTSSGSATGSWANITNMTSGAVTVTAGSACLILLQVPFVAQNANATPEFRIEIDGSPDGSDGALGFSQTGVDEVKHGCLAFIATGYSGSTTFAAEWIARLGTCALDTGREATFQVIEFLADEFSLLVDIQLSSFDTAPVSWATLLGFTGTPTVGSVNSVELMITNFVTWGVSADVTAEAMFAVDGTREGPQQNLTYVDNTNMLSHGLLVHAVDGLSGSTTFSVQWQRIQDAATLDTGRQRNFQVIELKYTTLQAAVEDQTSQSSPATWADMTSMTGTYTPASADSINIMACNPVIALEAGDKAADCRFADDGSREGPLLTAMFTDNTNEGSSGAMVWAKDGITGEHDFSFQWQDRVADPNLDTGRDRSFFLLECVTSVTHYSLACAGGTYGLTGTAAGLLAGRALDVAAGSYAFAGQAMTMTRGRILAVDSGSYALSGQDVALLVGRLLGAVSGTYTLTGQDVALMKSIIMAVDSGAFTLTGQIATLIYGKNIVVDSGTYNVTGTAVQLLLSRLVGAASGTYTLSGQDVNLLVGRLLSAGAGVYNLAGQDVTLSISTIMEALSGTYALAGQDVTLLADRYLGVDSGPFALTGQDAVLQLGRYISAEAGSYAFSGQDVTFKVDYVIDIGSGTYIVLGQSANLIYSAVTAFICDQWELRSLIRDEVLINSMIRGPLLGESLLSRIREEILLDGDICR